MRFPGGDRGCRGFRSGFSAAVRSAEVASGRVQLTREGGIACEGRRARARARATRRGLLEGELKGQRGRRGGARCFIDVESGTGPVRALPDAAAAKPGEANTATEITIGQIYGSM
jgi:hypothetical protein